MAKFINSIQEKELQNVTESVNSHEINHKEETVETVTRESVQDVIYNYKTAVPVDRSTRKMVYDIYKLEEDIKRAIAGGKDKTIITDMKREVVRLRKNLNTTKRGLSSEESKEVSRIEKAAISELKKMTYKESVDEEVITEGVVLGSFIAVASLVTVSLIYLKSSEKISRVKLKKAIKIYEKSNKDLIPISSMKKKKITLENAIKEINDQKTIEKIRSKIKKMNQVSDRDIDITFYTKDDKIMFGYISGELNPNKHEYTDKEKKDPDFEIPGKWKEVLFFVNDNSVKKHFDYYSNYIFGVDNEDAFNKKYIEWTNKILNQKNIKDSSIKKESVIDSLSSLNVDLITEKADLDAEMKPIVDKLNEKGYKVKYASPGHKNLRKREDKEPDGVYNGKLYSDARIMFDKEYNMGEAPKGWKWRIVDGCSYLDIKEKSHDPENDKRTPDEIFAEWKKEYMDSLRKFVDQLSSEDSGEVKDVKESVDNIFSETVQDLEDVLS